MFCIVSCGLCCSGNRLCLSCAHETLRASGLEDNIKNFNRIKELEPRNRGTSNPNFCEMDLELRKMLSE